MTNSTTLILDSKGLFCVGRAPHFPLAEKARRTITHLGDYDRIIRFPRIMRSLLLLLAVAAALSTSACTKKVMVPNVATMDLDQAKAMLATMQLKTGTVSSAEGAVIPGAYVLSQTPSAGQQVPANSPIDLAVALPVAVPNLVNSNLTDAVNTLQGIGLKVMLVKQPTANIFSKAKVVQQTPPASALVRHDAAVMLTVTAPPNLGVLLGALTKEPAYQKLNPEYRSVLDGFLK
jgi:beta-lactam-binding protein with PASTA domain